MITRKILNRTNFHCRGLHRRRADHIFLSTLLAVFMLAAAIVPAWAGGSAEETEQSEQKRSLTFTDQTDREVTIEQPVERIVTIPIPAASMMIALDGSADRLVGMHPKSKTALEEGILREFYPEALDIRSDIVGEGFTPNPESLIEIDPDIIFQWGHLGMDVVRPLENAGLNVGLLLYGSQEYLEGWIGMFGDVLGKAEKADRILEWHHSTLETIEGKTSEIPAGEKPKVLYFLRYLSGRKVAGKGTYNDFYIKLAGGTNPAGDMDRFPEVSEEQIIAWDPEVILLNGFESDLKPQHVYQTTTLADVSAVTNHRVYKVPLGGYRWDPPNQESPLMWKWLTMVFHPDRFDWDLREAIQSNYGWIYGKTPTDEQIDRILRLRMNSAAYGYERFE